MSEIKVYAFIGDVIKITKEDCDRWRLMYPHLNMADELSQLDMELEARRREGGSVKKWFSECVARLNGRNKRAERFNRGNNQQSNGSYSGSGKVSHADRTRAQAREALERIDRENGSASVRPTGGFVQ